MDEDTKPARVRRTTIEAFNDEMAVLDRPLDHEVEYVDDKPRSRWGRVVPALAAVGVLVGAGYVLGMRLVGGPLPWSGHLAMANVALPQTAAPPAAAIPAAMPALAPAPAAPAAEPSAPVAVAAAEDGAADAAPEKPAAPSRALHGSWSRVGHHHKKARRR